MVTATTKFQFSMVARVNDACQFKEEDLKPNLEFPFTLLAKMCLSKNVIEERDVPDQFIMGAMAIYYQVCGQAAAVTEASSTKCNQEGEPAVIHNYMSIIAVKNHNSSEDVLYDTISYYKHGTLGSVGTSNIITSVVGSWGKQQCGKNEKGLKSRLSLSPNLK
jgi:hypothetical protein